MPDSLPHYDVRGAFVTALLAALGNPAPPISYENVAFTPPAGAPCWLGVFWVPADSNAITCGSNGEDEQTGFFQVDVNVPINSGEAVVGKKLNDLKLYFAAGRSVTYNDAALTVTKSVISGARTVDVWFRRSLTVYYRTRTNRTP